MLIVLCSFSCTNKKEKQLATLNSMRIMTEDSFSLSDSLYKSEYNRLTQYLLVSRSPRSMEGVSFFTDVKQSKESLTKVYLKALSQKDSMNIAQSSLVLGGYFHYNLVTDSSYYYYSKTIEYYKKLNDTNKLQHTYLFLSSLLCDSGIYQEAEQQMDNAIALNSPKISDYDLYCQAYISGVIKLGLEDYDEAIELFSTANYILHTNKVTDYFTTYQISLNRVSIKNYLAKLYIYQHKYAEAETIVKSALLELENLNEVDRDLLLPLILNKQVRVELRTNRFKEALESISKLIELDKRLDNVYSINQDKILYAEYYYRLNKIKEGSKLIEEVLDSAYEHKDLLTKRAALGLMLSYDQNNLKKNFRVYQRVNDSIINRNNQVRSQFARLKYQSDTIVQSNQVLKEQNDLITLVSLLLIIGFIVLLIIIVFRNKAKEMSVIQMYQKDTERYYSSIIDIQNRVTSVQESERKKFAKELHDGVLNKLFIARFSLQQLEQDNIAATKDVLINEVLEVEKFIRNSSHTLLNDDKFSGSDFRQLIEELVTMQNRRKSTYFTFIIDSKLDLDLLPSHIKVNVYRVFQEAFQNVQKYAEAQTCVLEFIYLSENSFKVKIQDNGRGFNIQTVKKGLGLKNMGDRLHLLGSKLNIKSKIDKGTQIWFDITFKL